MSDAVQSCEATAQENMNRRGRPKTRCDTCASLKQKCGQGPHCPLWRALNEPSNEPPAQHVPAASPATRGKEVAEAESTAPTRRASSRPAARRDRGDEDPEYSQLRQNATGKRRREVFAEPASTEEQGEGGEEARATRHTPHMHGPRRALPRGPTPRAHTRSHAHTPAPAP